MCQYNCKLYCCDLWVSCIADLTHPLYVQLTLSDGQPVYYNQYAGLWVYLVCCISLCNVHDISLSLDLISRVPMGPEKSWIMKNEKSCPEKSWKWALILKSPENMLIFDHKGSEKSLRLVCQLWCSNYATNYMYNLVLFVCHIILYVKRFC